MAESIEDKTTDYSDFPRPNNNALIGFGLPYVGFVGSKAVKSGGEHVYSERVFNNEDIRIDSLKISLGEASAINLTGLAKVYPLIDGIWCGYGPYSPEELKTISEFTFEFDPDKFETAQEVYNTWKESIKGEA